MTKKLKHGDKFHTLSIEGGVVTVGREQVALEYTECSYPGGTKRRHYFALTDEEWSDSGSRYHEKDLWPCELAIHSPLDFPVKDFVYCKPEDVEAASKALKLVWINEAERRIARCNEIILTLKSGIEKASAV